MLSGNCGADHLLLDRITHALSHSSRSRTPTCLLFLDLNGFKAVNDTYGHSAGDRVLQQLGDRLTGLLRPQDTAARLGGDEFVVLCQDTGLEQAEGIAGRLRAVAAQPFGLDPHTVTLSAAIGIAIDNAADRPGQAAPAPKRSCTRQTCGCTGPRPASTTTTPAGGRSPTSRSPDTAAPARYLSQRPKAVRGGVVRLLRGATERSGPAGARPRDVDLELA